MDSMLTLIKTFDFLINQYKISIIIKDFSHIFLDTPPFAEFKNKYFCHSNPYCSLIKTNRKAFRHCVISSNSKLMEKISAQKNIKSGFWGICHGGVMEHIIPLFYDSFIIGAVVLGSFPCNKNRAESSFFRMNKLYGFDIQALRTNYEQNFSEKQFDDEDFLYLIRLCALYLEELIKKHIDISKIKVHQAKKHLVKKQNIILNSAIEYIKKNINHKISIQDIAGFCYCSQSTLSHLFKKNLDVGVAEYIIIERISYAKRLLRETNLTIIEISEKTGFCSSAYFSNVFKQYEKIPPKEYRQKFNTQN